MVTDNSTDDVDVDNDDLSISCCFSDWLRKCGLTTHNMDNYTRTDNNNYTIIMSTHPWSPVSHFLS